MCLMNITCCRPAFRQVGDYIIRQCFGRALSADLHSPARIDSFAGRRAGERERESAIGWPSPMPPAQAEEKRNDYNELVTLQNLQRVFDNLDKKCDKKIDSEELYEYLRFLGFRCNMTNVKDLIWEVDEDSDGCLSWQEFKNMFYRVRNDKTGWEPRQLYNVVEFMMHDKDCSGTIDMEECMEILFRRFGKEQLEAKVNEFFGQDEDGDNEVTFTEFLNVACGGDTEKTAKTPSLMLSQGIVKRSLDENQKLLKMVAKQQEAALKHNANLSATTSPSRR